jgi:hypothetical protein
MGPIPKFFIILGTALIIVGLLWEFGGQIFPWGKHLGRLPGDIVVEKPGFQFYFPLATSLIVSAVLSLLFYLFRSK